MAAIAETYTTPVIATTNAIIASSDANVDKGDIRYFRQFISANPASSGLPLVSTGTDSGAFGQLGTAGIADDAVTAAKIAANAVGASELADDAVDTAAIAASAVTNAKMAANSVSTVQVVDGSLTRVKIHAIDAPAEDEVLTYDSATGFFEWKTVAQILATTPLTDAALGTGSVSTTEIVDGSITRVKLHANDAPANNEAYCYDSATGFAKWLTAVELATAFPITTPGIADANVTAAKLASGAAVSNIGYTPARIATGTYGGDNTSARQITTGFQCKRVIISLTSAGAATEWTLVSETASDNYTIAGTSTPGSVLADDLSTSRLHASNGFIVDNGTDGTNASGETYHYMALG